MATRVTAIDVFRIWDGVRIVRKLLVWLAFGLYTCCAQVDPQEIIRHSVAANEADWKAAPSFSFIERDVTTKGGSKTVNTYEVLMIEGSPYNRLTAINDKPLSSAAQSQEKQKLEREIANRKKESPGAHAKRIAQFQRERQQDHMMLQEMIHAFNFKLTGSDKLDGHEVYVVEATPRTGYRQKSRDTKVLTGMRGKLWVDKNHYHWVKVEAEVFKPVSFGLFIAKVGPGTRFVLEQAPISRSLWLPKHFSMQLEASVLGHRRASVQDDMYKDYKRTGNLAGSRAAMAKK